MLTGLCLVAPVYVRARLGEGDSTAQMTFDLKLIAVKFRAPADLCTLLKTFQRNREGPNQCHQRIAGYLAVADGEITVV